jgi:branched-chain amino acid transport system permease protein
MQKFKKIVIWLFWIALISAPFVWVRLEYDFITQATTVSFRHDRLRFMAEQPPQLLGALAIIAAVVITARVLWRAPLVGATVQRWRRGTTSAPLRIAFLVVLLIVPLFTFSDKYLDMAVFMGLYIILALGLNITVGMAGLLVLGYAAFYGIGAYTFAILQRDFGVPFWMAFAPAAVAGAVFGFLLGLPSLRLRGDYLAIVTLGFGETTRYVLKNLSGLTGGDFGVIIKSNAKIPSLSLPFVDFSDVQVAYILIFLLVLVSIFVINRIHHSRIGRAWIAIREDEIAAQAMGINTVRMKIIAFVLSAIWAAVAGVFYAAYAGFVDPETFRFEESVLILSMVVLGGMGSGPGVIVGAIVLYIVPRLLRDQFPALIDYRLMIFGATMVVMMVFRPQGLIGSVRRKIELKAEDSA